MKSKVSIIVSVLFFGAIVIGFLSPPAYAFWYGEEPFDLEAEGVEDCDDLATFARSVQFGMFGFNNNPDEDKGKTIHVEGEVWDALILLSCVGGGCSHPDAGEEKFGAMLIDTDGNFIQGWGPDQNAIPAKMHPGGYVMLGQGGGFGGTSLTKQDWCGNVVWEWEIPIGNWDYGPRERGRPAWHHDYNNQGNPVGSFAPGQLPKFEGKTLILATHNAWDDFDYPKSWVHEGHPAIDTDHISENFWLLDDAIYIVDKKKRIKWQWFASEHYEQMGFSDAAKDGIRNTRLFGGGPAPPGVGRPGTDWSHFNNVNWLGPNRWCRDDDDCDDPRFHPDNIIFDSRSSGMIGIIAHDDMPGQWNKGDIIWRVGANFGEGTPWESLGYIIGPHNAHMIPDGLPGAGNIIVFDNGGWSTFGAQDYDTVTGCDGTWPSAMRDYSRILEFDPTTFELVWEYKNTEGFTDAWGNWNRKFFSSFISSVQRLPNGNTLICEGNQARIFEVNPAGRIVWEYIATNDPTGAPGVIGQAIYRAYKYPESWAPDMDCLAP